MIEEYVTEEEVIKILREKAIQDFGYSPTDEEILDFMKEHLPADIIVSVDESKLKN